VLEAVNSSRITTVAAAAAGAALALWWTLPLPDAGTICPPAGEGRMQCQLNEIWLTLSMRVLFLALAATLLVRLLLAAPSLWRARTAGTLLDAPTAMPTDDDTLVAASWDRTYAIDGSTSVLRQPRLRWTQAQSAPPEADRPLPLDREGRLAKGELRDWLASCRS
jgi:hypothetical protein